MPDSEGLILLTYIIENHPASLLNSNVMFKHLLCFCATVVTRGFFLHVVTIFTESMYFNRTSCSQSCHNYGEDFGSPISE